MPDQRSQRITDVFGAALERPPEARAAFLQEACGGDDLVRREVESLLSACTADGFFSASARPKDEDGMSSRLAVGTRLGPYEIVAFVGAGGMGAVYKARDTRLNRTVAIKLLPPEFAADRDRLRRFEHEARAAGSLNHPNIVILHDVGSVDGKPYLVTELLEGETLEKRMGGGALPVHKALDFAAQIARGLAAAHEKGIVHRDIKPANLFVTRDGVVKILDFGLAKLRVPEATASSVSEAATMSRASAPGLLLGTPGYMSPEQVEGLPADHRSDLFGVGVVLYEMLSGRRAFPGRTAVEVMAAILKHELPPLRAVRPDVPRALEAISAHCLEKRPEERFQSARDLAFDVERIAGTTESEGRLRRTVGRERIAWLLAALATASVLAVLLRPPTTRSPPQRKFAVNPPEGASFAVNESPVLSPDGKHLAFVGVDATGTRLVWVRALDDVEARPLPGTKGVAWAAFLFWSPDSQFLGFFAEGQLKKIAISGGPPLILAQAPDSRGGAWSSSGVIVFSPDLQSPLFRISDRGGAVTPLTSLDSSRAEVSHRLPSFLPGGDRFLFVIQSGNAANSGLYVGSLGSSARTRIAEVQSKAIFVPPGYLLFTRGATLVAQRFDPDRSQLSGDSRLVGEPVAARIGVFGERAFSAAHDGTLAYWAGGAVAGDQLAWFDRTGAQLETVGEPGAYQSVALSPDGRNVALERWDEAGGMTIWVHDLKRGIRSPFSVRSPGEWGPTWSPAGDRIAFGSLRGGYSSIYVKAYPGGEDDQLLLDTGRFTGPTDWSTDGRSIVFIDIPASDVGILPIGGRPHSIGASKFVEKDGRLSPDGQWLAFTSNESGAWETWLQSFPEPRSRIQVSTQGGSHPEWEPSGKELFYLAPNGTLMAVTVGTLHSNPEPPRALFRANVAGHPFKRSYSVARGGKRFLMIVSREADSVAPITVITNWTP